jgi:hypothetical protein
VLEAKKARINVTACHSNFRFWLCDDVKWYWSCEKWFRATILDLTQTFEDLVTGLFGWESRGGKRWIVMLKFAHQVKVDDGKKSATLQTWLNDGIDRD